MTVDELKKDAKNQADRVVISAVIFFALLGLIFVAKTTVIVAYCIITIIGGTLIYFLKTKFNNKIHLYQNAISFFSGLLLLILISVSDSAIEIHAVFYVFSILLIAFQNWKIQLPLIFFVLILHGMELEASFSNSNNWLVKFKDDFRYGTFLFHVIIDMMIFLLTSYWAILLKRRNEKHLDNIQSLSDQEIILNKNLNFANEIANGNLSTSYDLDQDDILGNALLSMRDSLVTAQIKDNQDRFINIGYAEASEIIRNNSNNLAQLTESILAYLIKYLNANQGAIFIADEDESSLKMTSCYALDRKKFLEKEIGIGEGIVGQCFIEMKTIYLSEVPDNYVFISSGLGEANPRAILVVPLKVNDKIFGVMEIASFNIFEKYQIDFVERIAETIASSISTVKINEKTQELLQSSQEQAEMLKSQEEEMRQNMEELAATQEEIERKSIELEKVRNDEKALFQARERELLDKIEKLSSK